MKKMWTLLKKDIWTSFTDKTILLMVLTPAILAMIFRMVYFDPWMLILTTGLFNDIIALFGGTRVPLLQDPAYFRTIYTVSSIWQEVGWGSIIYLSALSGVDSQLYEAASIDGAGKWKQLLHVTLPGIAPTIIIMLILRMGSLMSMGYEKTILLYNPSTYETADIISSYVYRAGLIEQDWSYSTAIGLFNSVINCILLFVTNQISKRTTESSLW
mgnify:CR=1 FL=1